MNLLGAILYDPATAGSVSTASLLAMTAIDTTNLRHTFTVPAHGKVLVKMKCAVSGGSGVPQILLGVMDGSTIVGRVAPSKGQDSASAQVLLVHSAEFVISGLTPGSVTWDAAYGVETVVASSVIRYGGPNNTAGGDASGGFVFEVWDPQPQTTTGQLSVDANGRVDVIKVAGTTQTAGDIPALINTLDDFVDTEVAAIKAKTDNLPADPADASDIAASHASLSTKLDTIDDFLDTEIAAIKAKTDNLPTSPAAAGDAMALTAAAVDAILDDPASGSTTVRQLLRGFAAALLGKASGLATATAVYRDPADTKAVITATVDADGNRTAVTLDLT